MLSFMKIIGRFITKQIENGSVRNKILRIGSKEFPANFGPLRGASVNAQICGPCGDTMDFWLYILGETIKKVQYTTDGCTHSIVCGSITAALAEGATLTDVFSMTP
ncbi:MAG: iron-sulfur cluster assembly scaffold protein, partial [Planctomycetes bacterium]|nr:iron-sulfur cluster assembly scaffold protein [Planctomycetota bacterium]